MFQRFLMKSIETIERIYLCLEKDIRITGKKSFVIR